MLPLIKVTQAQSQTTGGIQSGVLRIRNVAIVQNLAGYRVYFTHRLNFNHLPILAIRSSSASSDAAWAIAVELVMAMSRLALAAHINDPEST